MKLRIFRQPTKDIQDDGKFYTDTLQYQIGTTHTTQTHTGIQGIPLSHTSYSDWINVEIVEADSY